jgi:hypothetical protein
MEFKTRRMGIVTKLDIPESTVLTKAVSVAILTASDMMQNPVSRNRLLTYTSRINDVSINRLKFGYTEMSICVSALEEYIVTLHNDEDESLAELMRQQFMNEGMPLVLDYSLHRLRSQPSGVAL